MRGEAGLNEIIQDASIIGVVVVVVLAVQTQRNLLQLGKKLMAKIGGIIKFHVIIEGSMNSSNPHLFKFLETRLCCLRG
ncbi:hypothetical protein ACS0TY_034227 [Phlomoides rotata]